MSSEFQRVDENAGELRSRLIRGKPLSAGPFELRYLQRTPVEGDGGGAHGVETESQSSLNVYARTLELASEFLEGAPFRFEPLPRVSRAFIYDIGRVRSTPDPFTESYREDGRVFFDISLRNRTALRGAEEEVEYFRGAAIHEAAHVYSYSQTVSQCGGRGVSDRPKWGWFRESFAVLAECLFEEWSGAAKSERLPRCFSYARTWCDFPDGPVDSDEQRYASFLFLHYLGRRFGFELLAQVWKQATRDRDPWETIEDETKESKGALTLAYTADAYLLNDDASLCFWPLVYQRYGGRAVTRSVSLSAGRETIRGRVWPLGAVYFRVFVMGDSALRIELSGFGWGTVIDMAAGWATADLKRAGATLLAGAERVLHLEPAPDADHAWIAVAGLKGARPCAFEFSVEAMAGLSETAARSI